MILALFAAVAAQAQSEQDILDLNIQVVEFINERRQAEALKLAEETLPQAEKALGPEHPETLSSVGNLGAIYETAGRYGEAEILYQRALAGREKALGPKHRITLEGANNLGALYKSLGRYSEAEALHKRALAGEEETLGPDHPSTLTSLNNLGSLYSAQGRYSEAEPLLKRALQGREEALGREDAHTLRSLINLGLLYKTQGRYAEAEPLYKRALTGAEWSLGMHHPTTLATINNLAALYRQQERYSEAELLYKRALAGREKAHGPEHPLTLTTLQNLGFLYQALGRYSEAEPLFKRSLAGHENALGPEHPNTLSLINNLGFLYHKQDRYGEAEPLYKRALAGREKVLGAEHPDTLSSLNNLAALTFAQGDWRAAAHYWRRSTAGLAKSALRGAQNAGLSGETKSEAQRHDWQFAGLIRAAYRLAPEGGAPGAAAEMFETAQWALSSEAAQSLAQMAARGTKGDAALAALVRERQDLADEWQQREKIQTAALGRDPAKRDAKAEAENRERMAGIDRRLTEIDDRLKVGFPDYFAQVSPAPLPVREAQAQLGEDEALVLFLDTPERKGAPEETFIWVVTRTQMRWLRSDLGTAALAREVAALRCGLDRAAWEGQSSCAQLTGEYKAGAFLPFDPPRAHRLYKALFGRAEDLINGKHLLIVPSGPLAQLPFAVLVSAPMRGEDKTIAWLARDHAITILPAVSSLKALRATARPSRATKPMIGFGNPLLLGPGGQYAPSAARAAHNQRCHNGSVEAAGKVLIAHNMISQQTASGLANAAELQLLLPLPETADELCAVANHLRADAEDIRLGAGATETGVKALSGSGELARYRVVHFATHGVMAGELTTPSSEPGLVLTPPEHASELDDGYLSASEIARLKLDADWVILSACNTAAGNKTSAEPLSGLARAFIYAQARALLVSHWAVDSEATVKLITTAMSEITRGKTVGRSEAVRRAMMALFDSGNPREAHPSSWAPFIVVGEGAR